MAKTTIQDMNKPLGDSTTRPAMKSWGIGRGELPLTTDPENPFKFLATYDGDDDADDKK